ncbi:hypothetical protein GOP47_0014028 [Adiantum capillus-veneris]|uniref:FAF domain-containing protein n=1 Tax=Adiantum capillus-veneris TaxID=13818 RepID=A0A9D4UQ39_ADICA|nr:hypothetical protein GOP47_0014028 [Adiantum capillus-veneris]
MRNPSRTQQNSIFEPLFSQEEELRSPPTHLIHSSSSEWLSSTYSAPISHCIDRASSNNHLKKAPTTTFTQAMSTNQADTERKHSDLLRRSQLRCGESEPAIACSHGQPSPSTSTSVLGRSTSKSTPPPYRSLSLGNVNDRDDGSVASKLLTSITKSISSPSLLSSCKESARETPYQKTLRLRMMKLQHCAEELGSESSDGALIYGDGSANSSFDSFSMKNGSSQSLTTRSISARTLPSTVPQENQMSECDACPMMISVRSAPNLRCPSLVGRQNSHIKERSFPPPLVTHTLQRSASSDSFALSLRACREDGRFMLKEVKVPCRQYLQASRKDGRLTLQLFTSDEGMEQEEPAHEELEHVVDSQQDKHIGDVCEGTVSASTYGCGHKTGVESVNEADVEGELKGSAQIHDLHMNDSKGSISNLASVLDKRKNGGLSALKGLFMQTLNADNRGMADDYFQYLAPCEENMVLQSRSTRNALDTRVKRMLGLEISSASLQAAGFGMDRSLSSTIIFKDIGANSLMENVTKLVNSFGLDGGKWCQGKGEYSRALEGKGLRRFPAKDSSRYGDGISSINIGVKKVEDSGAHTANGVHILNVECERKSHEQINVSKGDQGGAWIDMNAVGVSTKCTTLQFDIQLPLQLDWLHNLYCKELFDRNNFVNKGFPFVAIRS